MTTPDFRARVALAQPEPEVPERLPPRVGHILRLAEIIREVDGSYDKGAAALAEAILSHPGSRWSPAIQPVAVAERPWVGRAWFDADGRCWWFNHAGIPEWQLASGGPYGDFSLPHYALPISQSTQPPTTP